METIKEGTTVYRRNCTNNYYSSINSTIMKKNFVLWLIPLQYYWY